MWKMEEATDTLREATYDTIWATDLATDVVENGMQGKGVIEVMPKLMYCKISYILL